MRLTVASHHREVLEGVQHQANDEEKVYSLDVTALGVNPTNAVVAVVSDGEDVTDDVMPDGEISYGSTALALPPLVSLDPGVLYVVVVIFEIGGQVVAPYIPVLGE